ncbi:MAG: hypothetical protein KJZ52_12570, partial [Anaerolineales bacterium]|nr:hypothetical protein [Anaerolineales bacterium]
MNDIIDFPKLFLEKFVWEKLNAKEELELNSGLNILHGKTQADRTILLRLVRYALGGSFERIDTKILESSVRVILKISANGEGLTFTRSCQQPNARLEIEDKDGKRSLSIQEISPYLLEKLGLPQVFTRTTDREGNRRDNPLSFNDLARAFVIDRDISYSAILAQVYERPFIEIVKIMFGLTTQEIADTENSICGKESEILELRQSINSIQTFLKRLDVPTLIEIESRRNGILEGLARLTQEEEDLRQNVRTSIEGEVSTYEPTKNELLSKRKELEEKQRELLNLSDQKKEKLEIKSLLSEEVKRLERHISSHYVISTFTFTICPRCSQEVTSEMQQRESEGLCSLCGRNLAEHNDTEAWEKSIRDTKQSIKEVDILIIDHEKRIEQLQREVKPLSGEVENLEKKLEQETRQYVSPIVEHLGLIVSARVSAERELSKLDYEKQQRELAIHYQEYDLPKIQKELDEVRRELTDLRNKLGNPSEYYNAFVTHFRTFLNRVDLDQPVEVVEW